MVRRALTVFTALTAVTLAGCGTGLPSGSTSTPTTNATTTALTAPARTETTSRAPCEPATPGVDLGSVMYGSPPNRYAATDAGWYLVTAAQFQHGGPFDPPVGRAQVAWGPSTTQPVYNPGPATVTGATGTFDVVEDAGTWVRLPAGTFWFISSAGARLTIQGCVDSQPKLIAATT